MELVRLEDSLYFPQDEVAAAAGWCTCTCCWCNFEIEIDL